MKQNIQELRDELVGLFYALKDGTVKPPVAVEMNNAAGKAINSAKLELEYLREKTRNKDLKIDFLDSAKMPAR